MNFLHEMAWVLPLRSPALTQLALGLSWLGYATFIMFFMTLGYWAWSRAIFTRLFVLVAVNGLVNAYAKDFFQDPRPPLALRLDDQIGDSFGLPSGHAQLAVVLWLWLAWEIRRPWAWVVGSLIALLVMLSRLYLGVHDVEDVLIGAALGGASLFAFVWLQSRVVLNAVWQQLALVLGITALALLSWPAGTSVPVYVPLLSGWLAVVVCCQPLELRWIGMQMPRTWARRIAVIALGIVCFYLEQKLLKAAAPHWTGDLLLWNFVKGLVNGVFVVLFMPWLLCRLRLTPSIPKPGTSTPSTPA